MDNKWKVTFRCKQCNYVWLKRAYPTSGICPRCEPSAYSVKVSTAYSVKVGSLAICIHLLFFRLIFIFNFISGSR